MRRVVAKLNSEGVHTISTSIHATAISTSSTGYVDDSIDYVQYIDRITSGGPTIMTSDRSSLSRHHQLKKFISLTDIHTHSPSTTTVSDDIQSHETKQSESKQGPRRGRSNKRRLACQAFLQILRGSSRFGRAPLYSERPVRSEDGQVVFSDLTESCLDDERGGDHGFILIS
ncbi:hypothetical protein CI109_102073 [Kwoniella shandongensis]|uniref:Uncharacterized protein n=1 Tax=Kwoniella shandongensis TaxID=1734106 RepID=A0AAJ8LH29_9TREE